MQSIAVTVPQFGEKFGYIMSREMKVKKAGFEFMLKCRQCRQ